MKPPVETVRISRQAKDQLMKVKRYTGIENWNILCRWALCLSLRERTAPAAYNQPLEGGVEMTWKVFAGDQADVFAALLLFRAQQDDVPESPEGIAACLRAHLHRGIGYLASGNNQRDLSDFVSRWVLK